MRRQVVCIHDVNTRIFPQSYSLAFRLLYRGLMPALGMAASAISTVSCYSADQLVRFGICPQDKIFVAPNGHEHALAWKIESAQAAVDTRVRNTIVLVGSPAPHKNSGIIIGLAARLAAAGLRIAVVGVSDPRVFRKFAPIPSISNVTWMGRLSDGEMSDLLQNSLCLAFPSFVEGFGLPPLEAMALGCPVVVSNRTSLPEICGEAALYAQPDRPDAWFDHFVRLSHSPSLRSDMIRRGRTQALRFSWRASAERYLKAIAAVDLMACRNVVAVHVSSMKMRCSGSRSI